MVAIWIIVGVAAAVGVLAFASLVPLPSIGIQAWNSEVTVQSYEIPLAVSTVFAITSVTGHTIGGSTLIDWSVLGISGPTIESSFTMTACETPTAGGSSLCASASSSQWFPSVNVGDEIVATNHFVLGFVSPGSYNIGVTLTENGATVATGSGTTCVPGC